MEAENQLIEQRLQKLKALYEKGINPYPYKFEQKHHAAEILEKFKKLKKEEHTQSKVAIAGRIMTFRPMGKAGFLHLLDDSGRVQVYVREDKLGKENYEIIRKLDLGDIIGVHGKIFRTKMGEITVEAGKIELLCKSLRPLPEKWHGLKDIEARYRQRYLDLIVNPEVKKTFVLRGLIIKHMREFLESRGFMEVDTPVLQPIYGGTNARPFKSVLHELKMPVYLRISNELYLKRLIVGGFEKIFEFSKDFRNEGIDSTHNPEFTLMETMWAYADYKDNMDLFEEMVEYIAKKVLGTTKIEYRGEKIDVKRPWKRMSMAESLQKIAGIDAESLDDKSLKKLLEEEKIEHEHFSRGAAVQLLFEELVEKKLVQPTIIYDYPHETCVLAKQKQDNRMYAERFEPFIFGWELGNSYTEENRPEVLKAEWEKQEQKHSKGDEEAQRMDRDFIKALEHGLPPVSGLGVGVDRLVMIFTGSESIKDVILFPFMK